MKIPIPVICLVVIPCAFGNQVSEDQVRFIEQYEKQKQIIEPAEALLNTDPEPDLSDGFINLYNGKNLDGWAICGGYCTFEAQGDVIVGTTIDGSPSTYLCTERDDFTDFVFTTEIKWLVQGNTGVIIRGGHKLDKDGHPSTAFGPQAEMEGVTSRQRNWSGGIYGQSAGGWFYPLWLDAHKEARGAIDMDDWNRITVMAKGETIKTWINGIPAAHWKTNEFLKGFFSLQVHSGKQGLIQFRNVKVKELD